MGEAGLRNGRLELARCEVDRGKVSLNATNAIAPLS